MHTGVKKSDNLQYDMLGPWVDRLIDQASVGYLDRLKLK